MTGGLRHARTGGWQPKVLMAMLPLFLLLILLLLPPTQLPTLPPGVGGVAALQAKVG